VATPGSRSRSRATHLRSCTLSSAGHRHGSAWNPPGSEISCSNARGRPLPGLPRRRVDCGAASPNGRPPPRRAQVPLRQVRVS
jgi:hypothetical protein